MPKTSAPPTSDSRFRIGDARVQPDRLVVCVDGIEHAIEPRVMEVLLMLAEHAGETVSAEQFLIQLWRGTFYGDNPVHKAITALRSVFGDSPRAPRYIETIRKRGYRLIAPVVYPGDYRRIALKTGEWTSGSPFVGLSAFDGAHAGVFCGRSRTTAELLGAMRRQIELQRRFVLVVGASGCGKTSLLQAGALPMLQQDGGFDGLQTLSYAHCDLAGVEPADATSVLASALAQWRLGEREVFPPQPSADLVAQWKTNPARIATDIEEAFRRHPSRDLAERPHAHLLLCIDHAESLVSGPAVDADAIRVFDDLLRRLCEAPRTLIAMIVRGDFYLKLVETLPDIAERKGGDGHVDVLTPRPGEIADIIRRPAALAGLAYEQDAHTSLHLDDVLRDAAAAQPDALPLLQHTLQALYERRDPGGRLLFSAYHAIGGLEGALAHRAEEVFATLPDTAQRSLDAVLSQMVVVQPENDSISARRIVLSTLDADARQLAETFVRARLFVAELDGDVPIVRVAHEALLRQWPRARDWAQDNRRILQARVRLQRAAARWVEEGKRDDHLLNPGRPLGEALEAVATFPDDTKEEERQFLHLSKKVDAKKKLVKHSMIAIMISLTLAAIALATITNASFHREATRRAEAKRLADFMLGDLAEELRNRGDTKLLSNISDESIKYLENQETSALDAEDLIMLSRAYCTLGEVMMKKKLNDKALTMFARSEETSRKSIAISNSSQRSLFQSGQSAYWMGYYYFRQKEYDKARPYWIKYESISKTLFRKSPRNTDYLIELAAAENNLGSIEKQTGHYPEAINHFMAAYDLKKRLLPSQSTTTFLIDYADTSSWIASTMESTGQINSSIAWRTNTMNILRSISESDPMALEIKRRLANEILMNARIHKRIGRLSEARSLIEKAIPVFVELTTKVPGNMQWKEDLAIGLIEASDIYSRSGYIEKQRKSINEAVTTLASADQETSRSRSWIITTISTAIGTAKADLPSAESIRKFRTNSDMLVGLFHKNNNDTRLLASATSALIYAASHEYETGRHEDAVKTLSTAIELIEPISHNSNDIEILEPWAIANSLLGNQEKVDEKIRALNSQGFSELASALSGIKKVHQKIFRKDTDHAPMPATRRR